MSFLNPDEDSQMFHPCKVWIEYKSKLKDFSYWDKEITNEDGSMGARASLGSNPMFILLDHTFCVSGWNNPKRYKLVSNEVKIPATKEAWATKRFRVSTMPADAAPVIEGPWGEISDTVTGRKGKLTINAYVAIKVKGVLTLGCIQFSGGSYGPFKDLFDKYKAGGEIYKKVIAVTNHELVTSGDNTFNAPVLALTNKAVADETYAACVELAKSLKAYLDVKLAEDLSAPTPQAATPAAAPIQASTPKPQAAAAAAPDMGTAPTPTEDDFKEAFGENPLEGGVDMGEDDLPF
jgi:hypothetical protein